MFGVGFAKSAAPQTSKEVPSFTGDFYALNRSPPTRKQIPSGADMYIYNIYICFGEADYWNMLE